MLIIFKVFIDFFTTAFCLVFYVFGHEACGILTPQPEIEPTHPALEGNVLTTWPPGKSPNSLFWWVNGSLPLNFLSNYSSSLSMAQIKESRAKEMGAGHQSHFFIVSIRAEWNKSIRRSITQLTHRSCQSILCQETQMGIKGKRKDKGKLEIKKTKDICKSM